jgi:hypothetical protein
VGLRHDDPDGERETTAEQSRCELGRQIEHDVLRCRC